MNEIEDEYYVVVEDFSTLEENYIYIGDNPPHVRRLRTDTQLQPLRYKIDEDNWNPKKVPADFSLITQGLLVTKEIRDKLFVTLMEAKIMMHPAYMVSPDKDFFEGYWLIATPEKPLSWLDLEKSNLRYLDEEKKDKIVYIKEYIFSELFNKLPLKERLYFEIELSFGSYAERVIHKSLVDELVKVTNREVNFIPLRKFKPRMSAQGPVPSFAI